MAPRRPRDIGTAAETAVVRYLQGHGWPHAERRALRGQADAGDITGTIGVAWSVKAGGYAQEPSDRQISEWLAELEQQRQHAGAGWAVLVTRRRGTGDPGRWWAWMPFAAIILLGHGARRHMPTGAVRMHLETAAALLQAAGYGTPEEAP